MKQKPLILWILLGIIVGVASVSAFVGGAEYYFQEGIKGILSSEVAGVRLTQKHVANIATFLFMPFMFGGILLAIYEFSIDFALKLLESAVIIVGVIGGALNYFFVLTLVTISLFLL